MLAEDVLDPLRYNIVCEQVIVAGDRIELISDFAPVVNTRALPTHYRESAPSDLARGRSIPEAIQKAMAVEIYAQLEAGTLSNAANLTNEDQLIALCQWILGI